MIIGVKLELMFNNKDKNSKGLNFGKENSDHRNDYICKRDNSNYVNYKPNNLNYIRKDMR